MKHETICTVGSMKSATSVLSGRAGLLLAAAMLLAGLTAAAQAADNPAQPAKKAGQTRAQKPWWVIRPSDNVGTIILDPNKAGPDYAVQGEYVTTNGDKKLGVQVVAMGKGTFSAAFLTDGLPGDGYTADKKRYTATGETKGGKTVFPAGKDGYEAVIENGTVTVKTSDGAKFTGKKVHRVSPTMGTKCPAGGIVLFDGTNTDAWKGGRIDERGLLCAGTESKKDFPDCHLHLEFLLPFKPDARGQSRGNSGLYIQHRYEVQVLDSFGVQPRSGDCGSLYRLHPPLLNMCFPPLTWQTYDIDFAAPKWDGDKKVKDAQITVRLNGVVVQDHQDIKRKTGAGQKEAPTGGPLLLQHHGNPVFYRNIWIVPKK